jgi:hypothetical protein
MTILMLAIVSLRAAVTFAAMALLWRRVRGGRTVPPGNADDFERYVLVNLVIAGAVLYLDVSFTPQPSVVVNHHDVFHYYVGSKYSPEVGYSNLYPCAILADAETNGGSTRVSSYRRMSDYDFGPVSEILAERDRYRGLFSDTRWNEFRGDVEIFRSRLGGPQEWQRLLRDMGYNPTPAWNVVARAISSTVSVRGPAGIAILAGLDLLLVVAMFGVTWRAFGRDTALWGLLFFLILFPLAPGHVRGGFLRMDWLAALVLGTSSIKIGRYKTAGALMAYASLVRIFPVVFVFGLGSKWVWGLARRRHWNRRYAGFFVAFTLTAVALVGLSVVHDGGVARWEEFADKIALHDSLSSPVRTGFKRVLLADVAADAASWHAMKATKLALFQRVQWLWWTIQIAVLAACFLAARRFEDYETVALGYVIAYFLFAPSFYYYVMLVIPGLFFLARLDRRRYVHGAIGLFSVSFVSYVLYAVSALIDHSLLPAGRAIWPHPSPVVTFVLSCLMLFSTLHVFYAVAGNRPEAGGNSS